MDFQVRFVVAGNGFGIILQFRNLSSDASDSRNAAYVKAGRVDFILILKRFLSTDFLSFENNEVVEIF